MTLRVSPLEHLKNRQTFGKKITCKTIVIETRRNITLIGPMFDTTFLDSYCIV